MFTVGSLLWGLIFDGVRPDRYDISGAIVCLLGVALVRAAVSSARPAQSIRPA